VPGWIAPARRTSPRITGYDYSLPGTYFVTICSRRRECLFGTVIDSAVLLSDIGLIVNQYWLEIPHHFPTVTLDLHVVMPNHVHGLLSLPSSNEAPQLDIAHDLNAIVGSFKAAATRSVNTRHAAQGFRLWQRSYYDHAVRTEQGLERIREYIVNNPLKWELDEYNPERRRQRRA